MPPDLNEGGDKVRYGIYNEALNIKLCFKLSSLQYMLTAKLTTIHETLQMIANNEDPTHIFTNSLKSLYLINIQIRYPTPQNNHNDKLILQKIVKLLHNKKSQVYMHKF